MDELARLVADQSARFATIDGMLPPVVAPEGERLRARLPDGRVACGVLYHTRNDPGSPASLWAAAHSWELSPLLGDTGAAGMAALLGLVRRRLRDSGNSADSAVTVAWPSRDAEAGRVLLQHGLVPASALAVRAAVPGDEPPPGVVVRRARPVDEEEIVELRLHELRYAALVGSSVVRPGAAGVLTAEVQQGLVFGHPMWLAEVAGMTVGLASCGWTSTGTIAGRLPEGRWGYVGTLSVTPHARSTGVGRALAHVAHRELAGPGVRGMFLFYNPANPLSSVFWHRQGYRPLWTFWEVRPASALR